MRTARCLLVIPMLLLCSGAAPIQAEEADWNVGLASIGPTIGLDPADLDNFSDQQAAAKVRYTKALQEKLVQ